MNLTPIPLSAATMLALAVPLASGCAPPARLRAEPALAGLAEFEATLAAHDSATLALEDWCARRAIAPVAQVSATLVEAQVTAQAGPATPHGLRAQLGAAAGEPLGFRHVRLDCGGVVLSEAFNWYRPALLTPEMNRALDGTRIPFGKVAAPLAYRRELIEARHGAAEGCPPGVVLSHRAQLRLPDGRPLALLVECYTGANLGR